jgi:hypothetical protein
MAQENELVAQISSLLSRTASAHRQYEIAELDGEVDPEWPKWYARYLVEQSRLGSLDEGLARWVSERQVEEFLVDADKRHRANAPDDKWEDYYARYLVEIALSDG